MGYLNGALGVSQPSVVAGMDAQYASANYIAQDALAAGLGLYEPDVDPEITRRYGRDDLQGLLTQIRGYHKAVTGSEEYWHFEKDFIHGILFAATAGAAANAPITFTLEANSEAAVSYTISPYTSTNTIATVVPRVYDVLQLPGRIELLVTSVNKGAGTFVAYRIDGGVQAAVAGTVEIIVKGNVQQEFSTAMETRTSRTLTYKNVLATHRSDFKASAKGMTTVSWIKDFGYSDGSKGDVWYLEGVSDEYQRFNNECAMLALDGGQIASTGIANLAGFETVTKSEGLITTIATSGTNINYSAGSLELSDLDTANRSLLKYKGDRDNILMAGYNFQSDFNKLSRNGDGVDFGVANAPSRMNFDITSKALDLDFKGITYNGFTYWTKMIGVFSDPTTLGATGQGYEDLAIGTPMGDTVVYNDQNAAGSSERVKSIAVRYKRDANGVNGYYQEWQTGGYSSAGKTDETSLSIHMIASRGLEVFASNRALLFS